MREKLLDVAEQMTQDRGLGSVTFQELADAVGLRKPSIFHHIKNKEELALALIERCSTKHAPQYQDVVGREIPAPEKLRRIAKIFENGLRDQRPCLMAALAGSRGSLSKAAQQKLGEKADRTVELFAKVFEQGRREGSLEFDGKPTHAAAGFFAMLQGLQTLARARDDLAAFKHAARAYVDSITK